jgi:predicted RNA-binding protein YlqC (UPF0109 family)
MKDLLLYIAQNLVDNPDDVTVTEKETKNETVFELHVAPGDMGKFIGRVILPSTKHGRPI